MSLVVISDDEGPSTSFQRERQAPKKITIYDCRSPDGGSIIVESCGPAFEDFRQLVSHQFSIPSTETFYLSTTDGTVLDLHKFKLLKDGNTVHLLQTQDQELLGATQEKISFTPHYNTLVRSGEYEYYSSDGHNALPYALAELIDNALAATVHNHAERKIELRLMFDETLGKPAVVFLDNGSGMTSKELNNWAVYRRSKFIREDSTFERNPNSYVRPEAVPRSINSDISCFGVGGKQAIFYIGNSVRMITRPRGCLNVHELILSKEDFEKKEKNKEEPYRTSIHNRKVGDSSHIKNEAQRFLETLIAEETGNESFTAVVITGILREHITFLRDDFDSWTRELAHIYHYYIHGTNGNVQGSSQNVNVQIQVSLRERPSRCPRVVNLRDVNDDMQTLYNKAANTFEFKAETRSGGRVEGMLRYHPFLYDRETHPKAPTNDEEEDMETSAVKEGNRCQPIFECFWNGRLIPYTTISELEWCQRPARHCTLPAECYRRLSGVLFADDHFKVTTNKLTFINLEEQLRSRETIFTRIVDGQEHRVTIQTEFKKWLNSCHEHLDKQIHFVQFEEITTLSDMPRDKQHPWSSFSYIEWDSWTCAPKKLVKSQKTHPIIYGSVVRFLLFGDHSREVYATGGQVEVTLEPEEIHEGKTKTFPISKIDRNASNDSIRKFIDTELTRLPDKLQVDWPEGNSVSNDAVMPAGRRIGPILVTILNKKGETISRMPSPPGQRTVRNLEVNLRVVWHGPTNEEVIHDFTARRPYHFNPMETLTKTGKYTLELRALLKDGADTILRLPSYKLTVTVTGGELKCFVVEEFDINHRVGAAFDMALTLQDDFGNPVPPPTDLRPQLTCRGLDVSYKKTTSRRGQFTIRGVKVHGSANYHQNSHELKVALPGLASGPQTLKFCLLPGEPSTLNVTSDNADTVENGTSKTFKIEIHDESQNITAQPNLVVYCRLPHQQHLSVDCSATGAGKLQLPINLRDMKEQRVVINAKFELLGHTSVSAVNKELTVLASTRVCRLEVYRHDAEGPTVLKDKGKVECQAGGVLGNLHYRLYDEGQRLLPLDQVTAGNMMVTWVAEVNLNDLAVGKLPSIEVPTQVNKNSRHVYKVTYRNNTTVAETSFFIVPRPDVPSQLKVIPHQASVKMGEVLPGDIYLQLLDQHCNLTQTITTQCVDQIRVEGTDLDSSSLDVSWQSSQKVVVRGVRFKPGLPGTRELTFTLRSFVAEVRVTLTAGPPTQLQLVNGPHQPLQVLNKQGITFPFLIQLCDEWGNPSPDQRVMVALTTSSPELMVDCPVTSKPVDQQGRASFTVRRVAGPRGEYRLEFGGQLDPSSPIRSLSIPLTVVLDPNKPVSLTVDYDTNASCPAGKTLPVFSVTIVSEEGGPTRNVDPAALSMKLWRFETNILTPPAQATTFQCSEPLENEMDHFQFHFRDKSAPKEMGKYSFQFTLNSGQRVLRSQLYGLEVVADKAIKLSPDSQPTTPIVSNTEEPASRVLVEDLIFRIRDTFGNPTGQESQGQVEVSVELCGEGGARDVDLPLLEAPGGRLRFRLTNGTAHVRTLSIKRNSPGSDGTEYVLVFEAQITGTASTLQPYRLPFRFYNDAATQRQMSALSQEKTRLNADLVTYRSHFNNLRGQERELRSTCQNASRNQTELQAQLPQMAALNSVVDVMAAIREEMANCERIQAEPRRTCSIEKHSEIPEVLGKVCHLALVTDDDAAHVISWHIQGHMDCVVTTTTAAARRVYDMTTGNQQVLPLDSVYVRPQDRPLPHQGTPEPSGNPMFARDVLIYPREPERCRKVFNNLLGDTILIDNLEAGNAYRMNVVQRNRPCPPILTRQGDRISSRGDFGGAQNRAPALRGLRGPVFGAPLPAEYNTHMAKIELLQRYSKAMQACQKAEEELDANSRTLSSPESQRMRQEMDEKEGRMREIDSQLARTSPRRRTLGRAAQEVGAGESSGPPQRRPRLF